MHSRTVGIAALVVLGLAGRVYAQHGLSQVASGSPTPLVPVARANTSAFKIDGVLDEPLWRSVPRISAFVQREPAEGAPATHATDVRVVITDEAVIIGARLADDPASFLAHAGGRAPLLSGFQDDLFEVEIDAHPGHLNALALAVSPSGVKSSWMVARDGSIDETWAVQWEAATHIDKDGWSLEIRLPLSELHARPGSEEWGMHFVRFSYARQETDAYGLPLGRQATAAAGGRHGSN